MPTLAKMVMVLVTIIATVTLFDVVDLKRAASHRDGRCPGHEPHQAGSHRDHGHMPLGRARYPDHRRRAGRCEREWPEGHLNAELLQA